MSVSSWPGALPPTAFLSWLHALAWEANGTKPWSWHLRREFYRLFCKCTNVGTSSAPFGRDAVLSAAPKELGFILGFSPCFAALQVLTSGSSWEISPSLHLLLRFAKVSGQFMREPEGLC